MSSLLCYTTHAASYLLHDTRAPATGGATFGLREGSVLALPGALLTACGPGGEVDRFLEDVRREFEVYEAETSVYGGVAPPIDLETLISRMLYERNRQHLGDDSDETDGGDESSVDDLKVAFSRNIGEVSREASRENFKATVISSSDPKDDPHHSLNALCSSYSASVTLSTSTSSSSTSSSSTSPYNLSSIHLVLPTRTSSFDSIGSTSRSSYSVGGVSSPSLAAAFLGCGRRTRPTIEELFLRHLDRNCEAGGDVVVYRLGREDGEVTKRVLKGRSDL